MLELNVPRQAKWLLGFLRSMLQASLRPVQQNVLAEFFAIGIIHYKQGFSS